MSVGDTSKSLSIVAVSGTPQPCRGCCENRESSPEAAAGVPAGFAAAITMAEAAADHNRTWWNEIRTHTPDPVAGEYYSSVLLGALLTSAAHRLGVPTADVWAHVRRSGELPL